MAHDRTTHRGDRDSITSRCRRGASTNGPGLTEPIGGYVLVKMTDDAGVAGWGEAPALKDWGGEFGRYFGESPGTTIEVVTRYLAPAVKGCVPGEIAELHARMDRAIKGYPYAKAAVEFAAYDLAGRQCGLAGASPARRRQPAAHSGHPFDRADRSSRRPSAKWRRSPAKASAPSRSRSASIPTATSRWCAASARRSGPASRSAVDANQGYRTPGEAIRTFRRMERYDLIYFEQPVEGIERLAEVARAIDVPVMADESAWNAHDVIQIIEKRAAQIVSIYTTKPGGLYRAMEVAAVARAAGHHLQRQRLGRDRHRQSRQSAARRRGARGGALLRRAGVDAGGGADRADRRHLLQGRPDRRADAVRRRRDRTADRGRHGHRRRRSEDPTLSRRRTRDADRAPCART